MGSLDHLGSRFIVYNLRFCLTIPTMYIQVFHCNINTRYILFSEKPYEKYISVEGHIILDQ